MKRSFGAFRAFGSNDPVNKADESTDEHAGQAWTTVPRPLREGDEPIARARPGVGLSRRHPPGPRGRATRPSPCQGPGHGRGQHRRDLGRRSVPSRGHRPSGVVAGVAEPAVSGPGSGVGLRRRPAPGPTLGSAPVRRSPSGQSDVGRSSEARATRTGAPPLPSGLNRRVDGRTQSAMARWRLVVVGGRTEQRCPRRHQVVGGATEESPESEGEGRS